MCFDIRNIQPPTPLLRGHASRIGYKIMGLFSDGKRVLSCDAPDIDFMSGTQRSTNPNGVQIADDTPPGHKHHHGRPKDKPRLHSEIAALQHVSNSLDPNFTLNHTDIALRAATDYSVLNQQLQKAKTDNPTTPLRVKFYIKNSAYLPCITEYNPPHETQTGASCNRYLYNFIRNFTQRYGINARMKVVSQGRETRYGY